MNGLVLPSFLAGLLTFFAPCTLPLVPGYLSFISGVSVRHLRGKDEIRRARRAVVLNGACYVAGFSIVFMVLGLLFGLGGAALFAYRPLLARLGGVFVMVFGLMMIGLPHFPLFGFLATERSLPFTRHLAPGRPLNSFLFGAAFAFGWTPCAGPILGSVLLLASNSSTIVSGALLLAVFSLGLGIPFLAIAFGIGTFADSFVLRVSRHLRMLQIVGGIILIVIGALLFADRLGFWIEYFYRIFGFLRYDGLLNYL